MNKRQAAEQQPDLDLTSSLPQLWNIRIRDKMYSISSDQPPQVLYRGAEIARKVHLAIEADEEPEEELHQLSALTARVLSITVEEAAALGWIAQVRLFSFLVKPLLDLATMMSLSAQFSPSPTPLTGA